MYPFSSDLIYECGYHDGYYGYYNDPYLLHDYNYLAGYEDGWYDHAYDAEWYYYDPLY